MSVTGYDEEIKEEIYTELCWRCIRQTGDSFNTQSSGGICPRCDFRTDLYKLIKDPCK